MAEAHPVGFQWVIEAKLRGARIIHIDPRFTRTTANADKHIPIRAGSDMVLLGAVIRYVLENELYFKEYVQAYTNATTLVSEDFVDAEDLGGVFSGFDPSTGHYDSTSWSYDDGEKKVGGTLDDTSGEHKAATGQAETAGAGGPALEHGEPLTDETMQHPRSVLQVLKRHFARYTPEMVREVCGIDLEDFQYLCDSIVANSGRERTTCFAYAVGWTQHTSGPQFIRTAGILQLLMGNVGRPGSGIMALRGHASIQGSTDIPTLYNLLPAYLPMPSAGVHDTFDEYVAKIASPTQKGYWAEARSYAVSLLKAWWGDAATPENNWAFDYLPKINGSHNTYATAMGMIDGEVDGFFILGQNPAVGSSHGRLQRAGLANLKWLVVRDLNLIESATFWKDGPEIRNGEWSTEDIGTEVFFMPAAAHAEKSGTFTQTQRILQWHHKAVQPPGDAQSELEFFYELGKRLRAKLADSTDPRDRPLLDLTWDYALDADGEIDAEDVLREINGYQLTGDLAGTLLDSYTQMKDDGSTSGGCWIYTGVYAGAINRSAKRVPGKEQTPSAQDWGWAWPSNRRILYNRASADPDGKPWSERKKLLWWDADQNRWVGDDVPDFPVNTAPDYRPQPGQGGGAGIAGNDPFIMQADGKGWLFAPRGIVDGPMPTHYEPPESPVDNQVYPIQRNPGRLMYPRKDNLTAPSGSEPGARVYPYVGTTYRLTEHHTAGGMSRWLPYLSELQPEFFCEVSPALAAERGLENGGWATLISARAVVEARVLVTERMRPLWVANQKVHQIGMPYHWGEGGQNTIVQGDSANDLLGVTLDPNVSIQESKTVTLDIIAGRRPTGEARERLYEEYLSRSGTTVTTGETREGIA